MIARLLFALLLLCWAYPLHAQLNADQMLELGYRRYGVESGIIEYRLTGNTTGTWTVYFDKWGWREARYENTTTRMMGVSSSSQSLAFIDGEWQYQIDLKTNAGTGFNNPLMKGLPDYMRTHKLGLAAQMVYDGGAAERQGIEKILNHPCQIFFVKDLGTSAWVWQDTAIVLREEGKLLGATISRVATSVRLQVPIPPDKLRLPPGAQITKSVIPGTQPGKQGAPPTVSVECEEILKASQQWASAYEAARSRCDAISLRLAALRAQRDEAGARRDEARGLAESAKAQEAALRQQAASLQTWLGTLQPAGSVYTAQESIPPGMQYIGSGGVFIAFTDANALQRKIDAFPASAPHSFASVFQSYASYQEKIQEQQAIQQEQSERAQAANQESRRLGEEIDKLKLEETACEAEEKALDARRAEIRQRDEECKAFFESRQQARKAKEDYERVLKEYDEMMQTATGLRKEAYEAIQTHQQTGPELEAYDQATKTLSSAGETLQQAAITAVSASQLMGAEQYPEAYGKYSQAWAKALDAVNLLRTHNQAMREIIRSANAKPVDLCEEFQSQVLRVEKYYVIDEILDVKLAVEPYTPERFESMKAKAQSVLDGLNRVNQIQMAGLGIEAGAIAGTQLMTNGAVAGKMLTLVGENLPSVSYDYATANWPEAAFNGFLTLLMSNKPRKIFFYTRCTEYTMQIRTECVKGVTGDMTYTVAEPLPGPGRSFDKTFSEALDPGFQIPSAHPDKREQVMQQLVNESIQQFIRSQMGKYHKQP